MKIVRRNLVLEFETTEGNKIELVILKPMEGLDAVDIKTAMENIVATGAFGDLSPASKVVGARYDVRQVEEVQLA